MRVWISNVRAHFLLMLLLYFLVADFVLDFVSLRHDEVLIILSNFFLFFFLF